MSFMSSLGDFASSISQASSIASSKTAIGGVLGSIFSPTEYTNNMVPEYTVTVSRQGDGSPEYPPIEILAYLGEDVSMSFSNDWDTPFANVLEKFGTVAALAGYSTATQAMTTKIWKGANMGEIQLPLTFVTRTDSMTDVMQPICDITRLSMPGIDKTGFFTSPGPSLSISDEATALLTGDTENSAIATGGQNLAGATKDMAVAPVNVAQTVTSSNTNAGTTSSSAGAVQNTAEVEPSKMEVATAQAKEGTEGLKGAVGAVTSMTNAVKVKNKIMLKIGKAILFDSVVIIDVSKAFKVVMDVNGRFMQATVNVTFSLHQTPSADDILKAYFPSVPSASDAIPVQAPVTQGTNHWGKNMGIYHIGAGTFEPYMKSQGY